MSSLAFDKQGKPFTFQRRAKKLLVRLFRNPSARGTCCQVLGVDGQPLYIDPETDYVEFRRAVNQVPGLYRLDQCDEDNSELVDAQPAYVSIDTARNAQTGDAGGDVNPLVIIQQMAAIQADVMKTMAQQQAALMAATAEILRGPYRPAPVMSVAELRNATPDDGDDDDDDDENDENDENDEEVAPEHPGTAALRMIEPHLPALGAFLYEKCAEFLGQIYSKNAATSPAATPAPMPVTVVTTAPTASPQSGAAVGVAAASSSPPAPSAPPVALTDVQEADAPVLDDDAASAGASTTDTGSAVPPAPQVTGATINATPIAPPIPTREQFAHLKAIRARLLPTERAIAENTISRMDPRMLAEWLAALSAMSIEDATALVQRMVAEIQSPAGSKQR